MNSTIKLSDGKYICVSKFGTSGVIIQLVSNEPVKRTDLFIKHSARSSWRDCSDNHFIGQRSLRFILSLAVTRNGGVTTDQRDLQAKPNAVRYWIQEQAPNGGWFDSIGLNPSTTETEAKKEARSWQFAFPNRKVRLITRTDEPVKF